MAIIIQYDTYLCMGYGKNYTMFTKEPAPSSNITVSVTKSSNIYSTININLVFGKGQSAKLETGRMYYSYDGKYTIRWYNSDGATWLKLNSITYDNVIGDRNALSLGNVEVNGDSVELWAKGNYGTASDQQDGFSRLNPKIYDIGVKYNQNNLELFDYYKRQFVPHVQLDSDTMTDALEEIKEKSTEDGRVFNEEEISITAHINFAPIDSSTYIDYTFNLSNSCIISIFMHPVTLKKYMVLRCKEFLYSRAPYSPMSIICVQNPSTNQWEFYDSFFTYSIQDVKIMRGEVYFSGYQGTTYLENGTLYVWKYDIIQKNCTTFISSTASSRLFVTAENNQYCWGQIAIDCDEFGMTIAYIASNPDDFYRFALYSMAFSYNANNTLVRVGDIYDAGYLMINNNNTTREHINVANINYGQYILYFNVNDTPSINSYPTSEVFAYAYLCLEANTTDGLISTASQYNTSFNYYDILENRTAPLTLRHVSNIKGGYIPIMTTGDIPQQAAQDKRRGGFHFMSLIPVSGIEYYYVPVYLGYAYRNKGIYALSCMPNHIMTKCNQTYLYPNTNNLTMNNLFPIYRSILNDNYGENSLYNNLWVGGTSYPVYNNAMIYIGYFDYISFITTIGDDIYIFGYYKENNQSTSVRKLYKCKIKI